MGTSELGRSVRPWPDRALPIPAVEVRRYACLGDSIVIQEAPPRSVVPPDDLYVWELMRLDLNDPVAIAHFCSTFGEVRLTLSPVDQLNGPDGLLTDFRAYAHGFYLYERDAVEPYLTQLNEETPTPTEFDTKRLESATAILGAIQASMRVQESLDSSRGFRVVQNHLPEDAEGFHVDDFRLAASELRDMTRILLALLGEPGMYEQGLEARHVQRGDTFSEHVSWFRGCVDAGLRSMPPRLVDDRAEDATSWPPKASLYTALCVEYFNAIVEAPHYRVCDLQGCAQVFVSQRGRTTKGGHRSDAIYCSTSCARAAAKRASRARQRQERNAAGPEGGAS